MSVGWAIIGLGNHAERKMAPAIARAGNARLVAVYSRDQGKAREFARRFGAEAGYDSIPDLLRHPGVDVVYIASPNGLHKEHTLLCAGAGKHVLVEKPMALSPSDCAQMIEACQRRGLKLGVGFHLRHHPGLQEARRLIASGVLGEVRLLQGQWASGVRGRLEPLPHYTSGTWWADPSLAGAGSMMGTGVHIIDLMRFLTSREVTRVTAFTDGQREGHPLEMTATALLALGQDYPLGMLVASRLLPDSRNDITVYGSEGRLWGQDMLGVDLKGRLEVNTSRVSTRVAYTAGDMYQAEVEDFSRCVLEGGEPAATGLDGLRVCQVTEALLRSAREGRAVDITPA